MDIYLRKYIRKDDTYEEMEVDIGLLVDAELPLRCVYEHHVAELNIRFLIQKMDCSLGSRYATPLLEIGKKLSEMNVPRNILIIGGILGVLDERNRISGILLSR